MDIDKRRGFGMSQPITDDYWNEFPPVELKPDLVRKLTPVTIGEDEWKEYEVGDFKPLERPGFMDFVLKASEEFSKKIDLLIKVKISQDVQGFLLWENERQLAYAAEHADEYAVVNHDSKFDEKHETLTRNIEILNDAEYFERYGHHIKEAFRVPADED